MKVLLHFLIICFSFLSIAQAQNSNSIIIGHIDSLKSKILKENRKVWIHVPDTYGNTLYAGQKYPVIYLLDGDGHFTSVVGMMQNLSSVNGNSITPKMIVVGIVNTNRMRDLTPSKAKTSLPFLDSITAAQTGGGENFISFIEKELIPYINAKYPTAPYKMLIGHSLGGLMAMHTLVNHNNLFNSYVSIDPSMWYDDGLLLKQTKPFLNTVITEDKSLYLGIANTMEKGWDTSNIFKDTTYTSSHIKSNLDLAKALNIRKGKGLYASWKYYNDDDHGSVPVITTYDAFRFFFKDFAFKPDMTLMMSDNVNLNKLITDHYMKVSAKMGYSIYPPEDYVNGLGYQVMSLNQTDKAEGLFKMNIEHYPSSYNAYDSMGDLYNQKGDKQKAIENYRKSLALKEVSYTREKLNELLKSTIK